MIVTVFDTIKEVFNMDVHDNINIKSHNYFILGTLLIISVLIFLPCNRSCEFSSWPITREMDKIKVIPGNNVSVPIIELLITNSHSVQREKKTGTCSREPVVRLSSVCRSRMGASLTVCDVTTGQLWSLSLSNLDWSPVYLVLRPALTLHIRELTPTHKRTHTTTQLCTHTHTNAPIVGLQVTTTTTP